MTAPPDDDPERIAERRAAERLAILGELRGEVMVFEPLAVRELSDTGAQIDTIFPLQLNSLHDLRLALGDTSIVVKGRVVHCSVTDMGNDVLTYRSGLEFVEMDARVQAALSSFLAAVRDGRRAV